MSTQLKHYYTDKEYLTIDRASDIKHEYLDGIIYDMSRASARHVQIVGNIAGELRTRLRDKPCLIYSTDLRVRVSPAGLYAYPDVVVVCTKPEFVDEELDTLTNPLFIVEVLSDSTKNYDRGEKFERYRTNPSFREYLLVAQDRVHVERFVRREDGMWLLYETNQLDEIIELVSVGCSIPIAEFYLKVTFPTSVPTPGTE